MKTDVIQLAEVFENFRNNCLQAYDLDPANYYTTPGLTWDAMLKYTEVLITYIYIYIYSIYTEKSVFEFLQYLYEN